MEIMMLIWLGIIIFTIVLEFLTYDLVSIFFSAGGVVVLILSIIDSLTPLHIHWAVQVTVFLVVSLVLVLCVRPVTKRYLRRNEVKTNIDAIVGQHGISLDDILVDGRGTVRVNGTVWTAVSNENILRDEKIEVLAVEGNKLIVKASK